MGRKDFLKRKFQKVLSILHKKREFYVLLLQFLEEFAILKALFANEEEIL
jgi:hypothetical protein